MAADTLTITPNLMRIVPDGSVGGAHDNLTQLPLVGGVSQLDRCNFGKTPFRPGQPVLIEIDGTLPAASIGLKLQVAQRFDPATGQRPATGSALWSDWLTISSAAGFAPQQELALPADAYWWRTNVTGTPAATTCGINFSGSK